MGATGEHDRPQALSGEAVRPAAGNRADPLEPRRSTTRRRLFRAATSGLASGFLVGGAYLLVQGGQAILSGIDCGRQTEQQCAFDREVAVHLARQQVLVGGALALLAIAIAMWLRASSKARSGPTREGS